MSKKTHKIASSYSHGLARPPIVVVVGHVDHGKTTLLDTIRKTQVAAREHGGITQHIGAYQVQLKTQNSKLKTNEEQYITFIDTPGHEAFAKMRSRGAAVADIAIVVVAADDSVMPQTKESIEQVKKAGIPMIVAVNKIDLPAANVSKVKQDLAKNGIQVEGFGGDVPIVEISAKQGTGIDKLLAMILLVAEMKELTGDATKPFEGVVIETRLDKGKGMVATVIVSEGTLTPGCSLYEGQAHVGKVRAMFDEFGKPVGAASPGKPVEILGFTTFPQVGTTLRSEECREEIVEEKKPVVNHIDDIPDFLKPIDTSDHLNIIIKADTAGSLEAIIEALDERIRIVSTGVGTVTDADILTARSTKAFVIGFNVKLASEVLNLAQAEKVVVRGYSIIYELLAELHEVAEGMAEVLTSERTLGTGKIIAEFPFNGQRIAGTKVADGRLVRGDQVKIMRGEEEIGRAKIKSIRHAKDEISKAEKGAECGVLLDRTVDFQVEDGIIAFTTG